MEPGFHGVRTRWIRGVWRSGALGAPDRPQHAAPSTPHPARRTQPAPPARPGPPQCNDRTVTADTVTAQDEVVDICRDLIRIDTSNPGDHSGPVERQAAEYVAAS